MLSLSSRSITYGNSVTLTAAAITEDDSADEIGPVSSGTVTVYLVGSTTPLGTSSTFDSKGDAKFTLSALSVATYSFTASYAPPSNLTTDINVSASAAVQATVDPASLAVTANSATTSYGDTLPTFTGSISGLANGDDITPTYNTSATSSSGIGSYPIAPALDDPDNRLGNYTLTTKDGTLTIDAAPTQTKLSSDNPSSITYNEPLTLAATVNDTDKNAAAGVPLTGTVTFYATPLGSTSAISLGSATVNNSGSATLSLTAAQAASLLTAGSYAIAADFSDMADSNFSSSDSSTAPMTVTLAAPTVTVNPVTLTYGTAYHRRLATGRVRERDRRLRQHRSCQRCVHLLQRQQRQPAPVLKAGNGQTKSVTFTPNDTTDYHAAVINAVVTIDVGQATPAVTVNPIAMTYGTALANSQLGGIATWIVNGSPANVSGTYTFSSGTSGTVLNAGNGQTESVTFTPNDTTDYATVTSASTMVNVSQATPTFTWTDQAGIFYGTAALGGPARCDGDLDRQRQFSDCRGHLHVHSCLRHGFAGRHWPETLGHVPARRYDGAPITRSPPERQLINVAQATPTITANFASNYFVDSANVATIETAATLSPSDPASDGQSLEGQFLTYAFSSGTTPETAAYVGSHAGSYTALVSFPGSTDYTAKTSGPYAFSVGTELSPRDQPVCPERARHQFPVRGGLGHPHAQWPRGRRERRCRRDARGRWTDAGLLCRLDRHRYGLDRCPERSRYLHRGGQLRGQFGLCASPTIRPRPSTSRRRMPSQTASSSSPLAQVTPSR